MKKVLLIGGGIVAVLVVFVLLTGDFNLSVGPAQQKEKIAAEPVSAESISFNAYRNEERGVALEYPATWQVVEEKTADPTQVVMFVSDIDTGAELNLNMRVQTDEQAENVTLEGLTSLFVQSHEQQYPEGVKVEEGGVILGGLPGRYMVYQASDSRVDAQWVLVWTEKDGIPYIITYSATQELYATYLPLVEQMLASFEILR